jgi:hypothetical protein
MVAVTKYAWKLHCQVLKKLITELRFLKNSHRNIYKPLVYQRYQIHIGTSIASSIHAYGSQTHLNSSTTYILKCIMHFQMQAFQSKKNNNNHQAF